MTQSLDEIRRLMWNYVGIVRSDRRLDCAIRRIKMLREDEERFRAIDTAAPVGLIIVSEKDLNVLHLNPSFCEIVGKGANALLGRPLSSIFTEAEKSKELAGIISGT